MLGKVYSFFGSVNLFRIAEENVFYLFANSDPLLMAAWELGVEKESEA